MTISDNFTEHHIIFLIAFKKEDMFPVWKRTCVLAQPEDMLSGWTSRHFFLFKECAFSLAKKTDLRIEHEDMPCFLFNRLGMSSFAARRHVLWFPTRSQVCLSKAMDYSLLFHITCMCKIEVLLVVCIEPDGTTQTKRKQMSDILWWINMSGRQCVRPEGLGNELPTMMEISKCWSLIDYTMLQQFSYVVPMQKQNTHAFKHVPNLFWRALGPENNV